MKTKKPILLVEDDSIDVKTVTRALKDLKITNELVVCEDGQKALDYLQECSDRLPCLILCDVNMPIMNGIEFVGKMKEDDTLCLLPVVMLTTSNEQRDKVDSFKLGVAGYIVKPVEYQNFVEAMRTVDMYWTLSEAAA